MRSKLERVKEELRARNIDYLILAPGSNMLYLTGFDEEQMERPLFYIVTQNEEFFVVPKLYEEQLSNHNLIVYTDGENPFKKIPIQKGRVVAIDDTMWSSFTIDILNYFSPSQLVKSSEVLKEIRMIKSCLLYTSPSSAASDVYKRQLQLVNSEIFRERCKTVF
nr:aminopeptidase P family N-terminal domain-containing protein [Sulfolobus acidocaldarius]